MNHPHSETEGLDAVLPAAPDASPAPEVVTLSLVSHTNVGKTTLARTLLRKDVGEVLDQAHVTEESEGFSLIEADGARLVLWDTPGFGDSARLLSRLRRSDQPVLWFLQQQWDRLVDRPFYSSQQATLNVREEADIVLYLVNATEEPEDAGYVLHELELLDWLGVPVLLLLNQIGEVGFDSLLFAEAAERWKRHTERFQAVHGVVALDAFSRCWVQEGTLLAKVEDSLPAARQPVMRRLRVAWEERNLAVFERSVEAMSRYLEDTARDREALASKRPSRDEKRLAMETLGKRLVRRTQELMRTLLTAHQLEGDAAAEIERQIESFAVDGEEPMDPERGALLGGVVSGALGGLAADILAGGLTFGGGLLAGALLGALGGAGLARGYQLVRADRFPEIAWTPAFLERLFEQTLLRYVAVAHFGRGRGEFASEEASEPWREAVAAVLRRDREARATRWKEWVDPRRAAPPLRPLVDRAARQVLVRGYPSAAGLLGIDPAALPRAAAGGPDSVASPARSGARHVDSSSGARHVDLEEVRE